MKTNILKRICLLLIILVTAGMEANAEKYMYYTLKIDKQAIYFYYAEYSYGLVSEEGRERVVGEEWSCSQKDYSSLGSYIKKVYIDSSVAEARPEYLNNLFYNLSGITEINGLEYLNTSETKEMNYMFAGCSSLATLDLSTFTTNNVVNMAGMFSGCSGLKELKIDGFVTNNVKIMTSMFSGCSALTDLDLSNFNTENVTNMSGMFSGCSALTNLNLRSFNTGKVEDMSYMFQYCSSLETLDLSSFETGSVSLMQSMFSFSDNLKHLDVSRFNTSNVEYMYNMFGGCSSLTTLDVSNFDTSKATEMSDMFLGCSSLVELVFRKFKPLETAKADRLFSSCNKLSTIYCDDTWSCASSQNMFWGCKSLKGAIPYSSYKLNADYANPVTGYFTNLPDTFDIKIAGTSVTSINCKDLTVLPGVTGTASYDNETKTLYLEDASITEKTLSGGYAIKTTLDTLHVNVEGECNISSSKGVGLHSNSRNVVIGGTGTLNIDASVAGIVMNSTAANSLDIDDEVTVNVEADTYGMVGREYVRRLLNRTDTTYTTTLKVGGENSKLSVKGTTRCFNTLGGFSPADGYKVTSPSHTAFDPASNTFCLVVATASGSGKIGTGLVLTLVPVAGAAVVIEKPYILGDVNGDGSITMADANMVVNYFLSTDPSSIANFNVAAADVNGDNAITMADANQIVNIFLGQ
jgi:surface protein